MQKLNEMIIFTYIRLQHFMTEYQKLEKCIKCIKVEKLKYNQLLESIYDEICFD